MLADPLEQVTTVLYLCYKNGNLKKIYKIEFSEGNFCSQAIQDTFEMIKAFGRYTSPFVRFRNLNLGRWIGGETDHNNCKIVTCVALKCFFDQRF